MGGAIVADIVVDAQGMRCPVPILKLRHAFVSARPGQIIRLLATDPGTEKDLHQMLQPEQHELVRTDCEAGCWSFWIRCH